MQFDYQMPVLIASISAILFGVIFPILPGFRINKHRLSLALGFGALSSIITFVAFFLGACGMLSAGWAGIGGAGVGTAYPLFYGSIFGASVLNIIGNMMVIKYLQKQFPGCIEVQTKYSLFLAAFLVTTAHTAYALYQFRTGTVS